MKVLRFRKTGWQDKTRTWGSWALYIYENRNHWLKNTEEKREQKVQTTQLHRWPKILRTLIAVHLSDQRVVPRQLTQLRLWLDFRRLAVRLLFWHLLEKQVYSKIPLKWEILHLLQQTHQNRLLWSRIITRHIGSSVLICTLSPEKTWSDQVSFWSQTVTTYMMILWNHLELITHCFADRNGVFQDDNAIIHKGALVTL